jgi:hypothetical protein
MQSTQIHGTGLLEKSALCFASMKSGLTALRRTAAQFAGGSISVMACEKGWARQRSAGFQLLFIQPVTRRWDLTIEL